MARSMQTKGLEELEAVRKRAQRQRSLGRIRREDSEHIVKVCDELETFIVQMDEKDDQDRGMF